MNKYIVKSTDGKYSITANFWTVGNEGLRFYQLPNDVDKTTENTYGKYMVAWFTTWDYWMLEDAHDRINDL